MLQIQYIRENREKVLEGLKIRNFKNPELIAQAILVDEERRKLQTETETIKSEANNLARRIGEHFKKGEKDQAEALKLETRLLKDKEKDIDTKLSELTVSIHDILVQIPNIPYSLVKQGKSAEDNEEVFTSGPASSGTFAPHWEVAAKHKLIDFEAGNKITGSGFPLYCNGGAKLQRALINFFLDEAVKAGFSEYQTPLLVNEESAYGTGQLPDKEGQMYHVTADNLYLIPTAEVPLTNIFRDVILKAEELPLKITAYSSCFRREAGSYGSDVRGLNRLHQFDKVEIVIVAHPDHSYNTLEMMVAHVKSLIEKLELPFRILRLCGGDMGFTSAMTYDFEVFAPGQSRWLEVSSVSNFETFQANRLKLRFRNEETKKTQLAHTLNGSALALPRIVAAILENHQTPEGIRIPAALVPYTGFEILK
ncbi:MAG: serine--tRNA ligase [Bacteroidetes bacterium]|nr:serine--tRNA ligase [Bacteroidota bacterium]MBU1718426.1 serine--tRNA ligase [Bacteroidota bacterium]